MKEIRLTFKADDFAMISQTLVEMGVGFHVEPADQPAAETGPTSAVRPSPPRRPKAPKKAKKVSPRQAAKPKTSALTGAERLRSAIVRNPTETGPDRSDPSASSPTNDLASLPPSRSPDEPSD